MYAILRLTSIFLLIWFCRTTVDTIHSLFPRTLLPVITWFALKSLVGHPAFALYLSILMSNEALHVASGVGGAQCVYFCQFTCTRGTNEKKDSILGASRSL